MEQCGPLATPPRAVRAPTMPQVFAAFCLLSALPYVCCLQNVSIVIQPPAVERGATATLHCIYDLEEAPLYAVKWYRGTHEFYRYSPNDAPPSKIFPYKGIHVDLSVSNASQVVLRNVGFNLSGNVSCEVTTDSPTFSTSMVSSQLKVIALPKYGPIIEAEKDKYDVGDLLRANCTTAPSKPSASLSFFLNGNPAGVPGTRVKEVGDGLTVSRLPLEVRLEAEHIVGGQAVLGCTALVATLYRQSAQLVLGTRTTEPVPERVTSPSGSTKPAHCCLLLLLLVHLLAS